MRQPERRDHQQQCRWSERKHTLLEQDYMALVAACDGISMVVCSFPTCEIKTTPTTLRPDLRPERAIAANFLHRGHDA